MSCASSARHRLGRPRRARRIVRIGPLHRVIGQREIADVARERAEMIEAEDERKRPRARQPAIGRLQSKNSAKRRRHPDRAVGVRAQRHRHQAAADRAAGAARRAAGHPRHVMRIARRAVMHILAGEVVGVFAHVERADQHGAGRLHALDQGGVARRRLEVAVDLRSGAGRKPLHVEQVLHRERHAGERAGIFPGRDRGIDRARFGARALRGDVGEGIQDRIMFGDPRQRRFGHAQRRQLPALHGLLRFPRPTARRAQPSWRDQAAKTLAGSVSSDSANSSTSRASLSDTSRLALTAGFQASSTGRPRLWRRRRYTRQAGQRPLFSHR